VFGPLPVGARENFLDTLRGERVGAALLLGATVIALVWSNSPWAGGYRALSEAVVGPASLGLDLTVAHWTADGLLAVFFFVVGVELKREFVVGSLRHVGSAVVPVVGAVGGMVVPALVYVAVVAGRGPLDGWATPVATDIAFAVALLGAFGRGLPIALRAFLLTLAVADDLLAILVIAVFYASGVQVVWLVAAGGMVVLFALATRWRWPGPLLVLLAVVAWVFMLHSGVHATIAGALLGLTAPARPGVGGGFRGARDGARDGPREGEGAGEGGRGGAGEGAASVAEAWEHRWRPVSSGVAVPLFALFAAGVTLDGGALRAAVADPPAQGVALGLVLGKPVGIVLATFLLVSLTRARLDAAVRWWDVVAVGAVAGIGFTVSLLIGGLAFPAGSPHADTVKAAVLVGSVAAATIGASLLRWRARVRVTGADGKSD